MLLHEVAAGIIDSASKKEHSVKSLVLNSKFKNIKQLYALVCETLKYRQVLEQILDSSQLLKRERKLAAKTKSFAAVLLYDFLFGKGLNTAGKWKACILNHKAALTTELARAKMKAGAVTNEQLIPKEIQAASVAIPRYVRVNMLKTTLDYVVQHFVWEGAEEVQNLASDYKSFVETVRNLKPKQFIRDIHVENLLVFAPGTDLHDHTLYKSGQIILQDKASCFPSYILCPPPGSHVIDCCAAPGNKTSHMAAIMQNKGEIFAFDLDRHRLKTMKKLCDTAGATNINFIHKDFLTVDPNDNRYSSVEFVLVDPSCSGSGIASRLNSLTDDENSTSKSRLESLAEFQKSIVKHAMSFPEVKVVTYSTCSVHREENEDVVAHVLQNCAGKFRLAHVLENWEHRGDGGGEIGEHCIRASPGEDLTNGFFVACFVRTSYKSLKHRTQSGPLQTASHAVTKLSSVCRSEETESGGGCAGSKKDGAEWIENESHKEQKKLNEKGSPNMEEEDESAAPAPEGETSQTSKRTLKKRRYRQRQALKKEVAAMGIVSETHKEDKSVAPVPKGENRQPSKRTLKKRRYRERQALKRKTAADGTDESDADSSQTAVAGIHDCSEVSRDDGVHEEAAKKMQLVATGKDAVFGDRKGFVQPMDKNESRTDRVEIDDSIELITPSIGEKPSVNFDRSVAANSSQGGEHKPSRRALRKRRNRINQALKRKIAAVETAEQQTESDGIETAEQQAESDGIERSNKVQKVSNQFGNLQRNNQNESGTDHVEIDNSIELKTSSIGEKQSVNVDRSVAADSSQGGEHKPSRRTLRKRRNRINQALKRKIVAVETAEQTTDRK